MQKLLAILVLTLGLNALAASREEVQGQNYQRKVEMVNKLHDMKQTFGEESRRLHLDYLAQNQGQKGKGNHEAFKQQMKARRDAFKGQIKSVRAGYKEQMKAHKAESKANRQKANQG